MIEVVAQPRLAHELLRGAFETVPADERPLILAFPGAMRPPEWMIVEDPRFSDAALGLLRTADPNVRKLLFLSGPHSFSDPIWECVIGDSNRSIVMVVDAGQSIQADVEVRFDTSWERVAQGVTGVLSDFPYLTCLAHLVALIGPFGALSFSFDPDTLSWKRRLHYDPQAVPRALDPTQTATVAQCVLAGIVAHGIVAEAGDDLRGGVRAGLAAAQALSLGRPITEAAGQLLTSYEAREIAKESPFSVSLPQWWEASELPDTWTVLQARYPTDQQAYRLALQIISNGAAEALWDVPKLNIGLLNTIDRKEIESLTELQGLIIKYIKDTNDARPLNIAVFGTPGSGKSFAVKQITAAVAAKLAGIGFTIPSVPEFNLTQMAAPADLSQALQTVEAQSSPSSIPLVFWDEFDRNLGTVQLGWLESFLMPMWDAKYVISNTPRSFGKALLVFAGGTCPTFAEFEKSVRLQPPSTKAHDFLTRLRFHLNIPPVNHPESGHVDNFALLRRALLIRSTLERAAPDLFTRARAPGVPPVDPKVARGLLLTRAYKGGARSIESIIRSSNLSGACLRMADLPGENVLQGHVDVLEFRRRMHELLDDDADEIFPTTFGWPLKNDDPRYLAWRRRP